MPRKPTRAQLPRSLGDSAWDAARRAELPIARMPSILAIPLRSWADEVSPVLRLWHAVETVELSLRFVVFLAVAELAHRGRSPGALVRELRTSIERPTLGQWRSLCQALTRATDRLPDLLVPELAEWAERRLFSFLDGAGSQQSFLKLRHRLAHGGPIKLGLAASMLATWAPRFSEVFSDAPWIEEIELLARSDRGGWGLLRGPTVDLQAYTPGASLSAALAALPPRRDLVVLARDSRCRVLWPLALYGVPLSPEVFSSTTRAVPQVYSRRGELELEYTPIGSDDVSESVADPEALAAFIRTIGLDGSPDDARTFTVQGFESEVERELAEIVGREREVDEIVDIILRADGGVFWLPGGAGAGKSSLVARASVSARERITARPASEARSVFLYRFRIGDPRCDRHIFLQFAVERLEHRMGSGVPRARDSSPKARIEQLVRLSAGLPAVFLLDGLDELAERDSAFVDEVVGALRLPGLVWVCAGRDERGLPEAFARIGSQPALREGLQPMSEGDVRALLVDRLGSARRGFLADQHDRKGAFNVFARGVYRASGGLPIYLRYVLADLRAGRLRPEVDPLPSLPTSLDAYHDRTIQRAGVGSTAVVRTAMLALLAVVREPVSVEWIEALLSCGTDCLDAEADPHAMTRRALAGIGPVVRTSVDREGRSALRLYHHSFRERLSRHPEMEGVVRRALGWIARLAASPDEHPEVLRSYLRRWGARHLLARGTDADRRALTALLDRPGYVVGRWTERAAHEELLDDLVDAHAWFSLHQEPSRVPDLLLDCVAGDAVSGMFDEPERLHAMLVYRRNLTLYEAFLERACFEVCWSTRGVEPSRATRLALAFSGRRASLLRRGARFDESLRLLADCLRRHESMAPESRSLREVARVEYDLAFVAYLDGDRRRAAAYLDASRRHSEEDGDEIGAWISRCVGALVEFNLGDHDGVAFARVLAAAREFFEPTARRTGDPTAVRWVRNVTMHGVEAALGAGDGERAWRLIHAYEEDPWNVRYGDPERLALLKAQAHLFNGDAAEAAHLLRRVLFDEAGVERCGPLTEALAWRFLHYGDALHALGDGQAARTAWGRALEFPAEVGNRSAQALARSRLDG